MRILTTFKYLVNGVKKLCLEIFIPNRKIRRIMKGDMAKNYLKKYVKSAIKETEAQTLEQKEIKDYIIWQFWDTEIENAPEIVKRCVESIDKFEPNKKHIILNLDNIEKYIELPQKYYSLLKSGNMGMAHFTDILRTYLLVKYGGCWIDSTVLLTDKLPEYITSSELFLFQNYPNDDLDGLNIANYFIHSKPNNKIMMTMKTALEKYWDDNDFVANYFFYLHMFTMISTWDEEKHNNWNTIPFVSFIPVQHFQRELLNRFDNARWEEIKSTTGIHKLTYKPKIIGLKNNTDISNTFYEKLIKGELR